MAIGDGWVNNSWVDAGWTVGAWLADVVATLEEGMKQYRDSRRR